MSIDLKCRLCDHRWWLTVTRADAAKDGAVWPCPCCNAEGSGHRVPSAPHVMNPNVAAPDGTGRKGWKELVAADRLEGEMIDMAPDDRAKAEKELKNIKSKIPEGTI